MIADRYLYLPLLGVALGVAHVVERAVDSGRVRGGAIAVGAAIVACAMSVETHASSLRFRDGRTLFEHEVLLDPDNHVAIDELLTVLVNAGSADLASALALNSSNRAHDHGDDVSAIRYLLAHVRIEVRGLPEREQATLSVLRDSLDLAATRPELRVETSRIRASYRLPASLHRRLLSDIDAFVLPRALAHLRTGDSVGAEAILRATGSPPRDPRVAELLALTLARRFDQAGARRVLRESEPRAGAYASSLRSFEVRLGRVDAIRARCTARGVDARLCDADVLIELGAPRRALESIEATGVRTGYSESLVVRALAVDGFGDEALRRLVLAEREFPGDASLADARRDVRDE